MSQQKQRDTIRAMKEPECYFHLARFPLHAQVKKKYLIAHHTFIDTYSNSGSPMFTAWDRSDGCSWEWGENSLESQLFVNISNCESYIWRVLAFSTNIIVLWFRHIQLKASRDFNVHKPVEGIDSLLLYQHFRSNKET